MKKITLLWLCLLLPLLGALAQTYPTGFSQQQVATGITNPAAMAFAPDGRLFVCQQNGVIRIIKNGALLATPFASFSVDANGERGLLGIDFDPNFASNGFIYLYYTPPGAPNNRLSRVTASGDLMVSGSEVPILNFDPLSSATNHNGGFIQFGPDGKLYVAIGENANTAHSQNYDTYHGKLLRINADGSAPADNPFFNSTPDGTPPTEQSKRVWAFGLRNPYTFDIQPGTGKIFVNDVGGGAYEEINDATTGGKNFGWPNQEGPPVAGFQAPVYYYAHGSGDGVGCAITGGTFFNPPSTNYPSNYTGNYFYLDFCNNWINRLELSGSTATRQPFATNIADDPVCLITGPDGNLYYISRTADAVYRIIYTPSTSAPVITTQPVSQTVQVGQSVTFSVTATGTAPLSYQWKKNDVNISGATASSYTINSVATGDAGTYKVTVSNSVGNVTSNGATLTVTAPNSPPTATINTPAAGSTYAGGNVISFSGNGTDPEDGTLAGSAFEWRVDFHHADHTHPGPAVTLNADGKSGTFTIPTEGETATDVYYRLYLTVRDSQGSTNTTFRDILPRLSQITLTTAPAGLKVALDGAQVTAPYTFSRVEGILMTIAPVSPQTNPTDGQTYTFTNWQHGGTATQTFGTPVNDATYQANYSVSTGLRDPENPTNTVSGLNYRYYEGDWDVLPNFSALTPVKSGTVSNFSLTPRNRSDRFGFVYEGFVRATADGQYDFFTSSDDGSRLYIGSTLVVDNDGLHSLRERTGRIGLKQGLHAIRVEFFDKTGTQALTVSWDGPTFGKRRIPNNALARLNTGGASVQKVPEGESVLVYPNPAEEEIHVVVSDEFTDATVRIYNISGRLMKEFTLEGNEGSTDTDDLPSGVYILTIQKNDRMQTKKVVVSK